MDDPIGMQIAEGKCYVGAKVQLKVVWQRILRPLKELGKALVAQFHEEDRKARVGVLIGVDVLDNVGVLGCAEEIALLLELCQQRVCAGVAEPEESRVHDLCSADELITFGLADNAIRPTAQGLLPVQGQVVVAKVLP